MIFYPDLEEYQGGNSILKASSSDQGTEYGEFPDKGGEA